MSRVVSSCLAVCATLVLHACSADKTSGPIAVARLSVATSVGSLQYGQTAQLIVTVVGVNGDVLSGRAVSWKSSNDSVATVTPGGVVTAGAVRGGTAESVVITVTCEGQTASTSLAVLPIPVAAVAVTIAPSALYVGQTGQLSVMLTDVTGSPVTGRVVAWSSGAPAIATITPQGLVTAMAPGTAVMTAAVEGKTATVGVTVALVPVQRVVVAPHSGTLYVGQTRQLVASAQDSAGNVLPGRAVAWSSGAPAIATITPQGLVTAMARGTAVMTATVEGQTAQLSVSVGNIQIVAAMDSQPVARMGTLYAPQLRARLLLNGIAKGGVPVRWYTADSTNGWVLALSDTSDDKGFISANWVSGSSVEQAVGISSGGGGGLTLMFKAAKWASSTAGRGNYFLKDDERWADGFRVTLRALSAPAYTYYAAMQFTGGYLGYQIQADGRRNFIFSIWDRPGYWNTVVAKDPAATCVHGTEGGTVLGCGLTYAWQTGKSYTFELMMALGDGYSDYSVFVTDSVANRRFLFATIRAHPHKGNYPDVNPIGNAGFATWTEDFGPAAPSCFEVRVHDVLAYDAAYFIDNAWAPMTRVYTSSTAYDTGCQNRSFGKQGNGVRLTGGGWRVDPPLPINTAIQFRLP